MPIRDPIVRREKQKEYNRAFRLRHGARLRAKARLPRVYAKKYGITEQHFYAMVAIQNNRCAICRNPQRKGTLDIDHDHDTGAVRSLLCRRCNIGLGHFLHSPVLLTTAAMYLTSHQKAEKCS